MTTEHESALRRLASGATFTVPFMLGTDVVSEEHRVRGRFIDEVLAGATVDEAETTSRREYEERMGERLAERGVTMDELTALGVSPAIIAGAERAQEPADG